MVRPPGTRLRVVLLFAGLALGTGLALATGLYYGYVRNPGTPTLDAIVSGGTIAGFLVLGLLIGVWRFVDEHVAKPVDRLAGELRARAHSHIKSDLADLNAEHLGDLVPAATALMRHLTTTRNELAEAVARETTYQIIEKERLMTLIGDLPTGVVLCTADHRLVLYNGHARALLGEPDSVDAPGLDRSLFEYLEAEPIRQAYQRLLAGNDPDAQYEVVCATVDMSRSVVARIRLLVADLLATPEDSDAGYVMTLHKTTASSRSQFASPRTVACDFELLMKDHSAEFGDAALADLTYVVFDTETTGLLPGSGDEIVQLAAVRIVNGKIVQTEVLDTLVNPDRTIPPSSTLIHGITDAMVADAPRIETVARRLHKFAQGAVLVAHNADFDLAFLRRDEIRTGVRFDHPVLDTVLMSAIVFGDAENHSLDALTARLDVTLTEQARHTAIGDATATAEVFLKLIPALESRGLTTLGALQAEIRHHDRWVKSRMARLA